MAKKMSIDMKFMKELAELLADSDLSEIEIEEDETKIRLARNTAVTFAAAAAAPAPVAAQTAMPAPAPAAATPAAEAASGDPVTSPMVGTAYLSPAPEADPFVKVGDSVKKGQTILIVEAMKTMNQIPAPRDGKIASIRVEDAQPVEFGEVLLTLE